MGDCPVGVGEEANDQWAKERRRTYGPRRGSARNGPEREGGGKAKERKRKGEERKRIPSSKVRSNLDLFSILFRLCLPPRSTLTPASPVCLDSACAPAAFPPSSSLSLPFLLRERNRESSNTALKPPPLCPRFHVFHTREGGWGGGLWSGPEREEWGGGTGRRRGSAKARPPRKEWTRQGDTPIPRLPPSQGTPPYTQSEGTEYVGGPTGSIEEETWREDGTGGNHGRY